MDIEIPILMSATSLLMPKMGESITEGTIINWLVAEGESFEEGFQSVPIDWGINSARKNSFFNKVKEIRCCNRLITI